MLNPNRSCQTCRWWYTLRGQWYCQFAPCSGCYWNPEHPKWEAPDSPILNRDDVDTAYHRYLDLKLDGITPFVESMTCGGSECCAYENCHDEEGDLPCLRAVEKARAVLASPLPPRKSPQTGGDHE